jgi:hypothetical protein
MPNAKYMKSRYPWLPIFTGTKHRCLKSGRTFELTKEWCVKTWDGKCSLTGIPFELNRPMRGVFSPSIDRIDNSKGYTPDNSRWVLFGVNLFKFTATDAEMFMIANALIKQDGRTGS